MRSLGQIAVRVKTLRPDDSLGKAAEAIRASTVGAVPVVYQERLLGLLTAAALAEFLTDGGPDDPFRARVDDLPLELAIALPDGLQPGEALAFLEANDLERAPVLDGTGGLVGMVTKAELVSAVCGRVRPPVIGGMATPFGVYLTGGGARGGVSDLALVTTGIYLTVIEFAAFALADYLVGSGRWVSRLPALAEWLERMPSSYPVTLAGMLLFALMFRMSWIITGYHAAEHQVVHTIEAGDELLPEVVREKPRVHPRCGTNLVVAVGLMSAFWYSSWFHNLPMGPMLAMLTTFFLWRRVGGWVQQHVTTTPASPRQIESGIRAGRQLMERYQQGVTLRHPFQRFWNMGLLQVLGGMLLVWALLFLLEVAHVPLPDALKM